MENCTDDDIIIFGDADEIPNLEKISNLKEINQDNIFCFLQDNNNFYINNIASTNWRGNIMSKYKNVKNKSLNYLRTDSKNSNLENFIYVENGGWHLSFIGGVDRIKEKIKSYSHQEFNTPSILDNIEINMNQNRDLFRRNNQSYQSKNEKFYFDNMKKVDMIGFFPKKIVDLVKNKYPYLIKQ
jgi:beta-1,4-mannosyl-glycoprotein beta-1,4-N-acetylglucosaminyltransferase